MLFEYFIIPQKLAGVFAIASFLLLAHAHNRKYHISNLLKRGIKTDGIVLEMRRNPGSLFDKIEGEGFAPVVEYTTQSGNTLKHYSNTFKTNSKYQVGQTVPIWYINYRSIREAALEDDEVGSLPKKLFMLGMTLLIITLPRIVVGLLGFYN